MNLNETKKQIANFRNQVQTYRDLLLESRDRTMPRIVKNGEMIAENKKALNREYARLEKFIKNLGNNPKMNDGVNPQVYYAYHNAFCKFN